MTTRTIIKKLNSIYYAFFVLAIAVASMGFKLLQAGSMINERSETGITISSLLILLIIGSVPLSLRFFSKNVKKLANSGMEEEEKLKAYLKASVIRLLIMGTGLLLGVLFFYIMQSKSMLFCAGISAIGLFFAKPAEVKLIAELRIGAESEEADMKEADTEEMQESEKNKDLLETQANNDMLENEATKNQQ